MIEDCLRTALGDSRQATRILNVRRQTEVNTFTAITLDGEENFVKLMSEEKITRILAGTCTIIPLENEVDAHILNKHTHTHSLTDFSKKVNVKSSHSILGNVDIPDSLENDDKTVVATVTETKELHVPYSTHSFIRTSLLGIRRRALCNRREKL